MGLNQPLWVQYLTYLGQLLRFDLGSSITSRGLEVKEVIGQYFPATVELSLFAMVVAIALGVGIGLISASKPNTIFDVAGRLFGIITYALPLFWMGMVMQIVFSVQLKWFPLGTRFPVGMTTPTKITGLYVLDSLLTLNVGQFFTALHYVALPSLTLGILISGIFERIVRVNLKKTLQSDYVEAARARGIPKSRILFAHAFKNALIPVITVMGLTFAV